MRRWRDRRYPSAPLCSLRKASSSPPRRKEYERAVKTQRQSPEVLAAPQELANTVRDLERRGLLQYDHQSKRHDLHPVVRGVASGGLRPEEKDRYGQRVVDHFSQKAHSPYKEAETLEDLRDGLHVVRTLLKMGRYQQACDAYRGDLSYALAFNLEAEAEVLSLLCSGPSSPKVGIPCPMLSMIGPAPIWQTDAAHALLGTDEPKEALAARGAALPINLANADWQSMGTGLRNISFALDAQQRTANEERCLLLALDLAALTDDQEGLFRARLNRFWYLVRIGHWPDAQAMWQLLDPMGRDWSRGIYRPGDAEYAYARFQFHKGDLREEHLAMPNNWPM